jgi:amino acid permease
MSIAVNSLTGPAMLNLPATFSKSGIIPTIGTLIFVCILSALCCLHMANTISKVPHNHNFKKEVEYSEAYQYFWGRNWFVVTQVPVLLLHYLSQHVPLSIRRTWWIPFGTPGLKV